MLDKAQPGTLEYWAETDPDRIALIKEDRELTYGAWNDKSNRLADALVELGLKQGDRLGMRFRLDFPWFVMQRAMQKLGIALVAVNWKLTAEEAMYIIKDSGAIGLACDDLDVSPWDEQPELGLLFTAGQEADAPGQRIEDLVSGGKPVQRFGPNRADSVLYTSGTTGRPKGVPPLAAEALRKDATIRHLKSVSAVPPLPDHPVILLSLPLHHGAGPAAARNAAFKGGTVVLLDPYDPEKALQLTEKHSIQVWTSVPTMLLRIQALPEDVFERYDLSSFTAWNTGAAPVPESLKQWIFEKIGTDVLWESYGCSEAGMLTYISPQDQLERPLSSGKPYAEVELKIVDDAWNALPPGQTGEIAARTPFVLKNYLGRSPLGEDTIKDGFYRTGDVGHVDEEGYLYITDRIKDMIVAGGVNIYPAEIERAIFEHPAVENCAVIGIPQEDFGEQILAFVVSRPKKTIDTDELASFLEPRLAKFKRPRIYEVVDELPLNPTGKVLKNELRQPYWEGRERNV